MLEKILEEINSNLIRIATAIESDNSQRAEANKYFTGVINDLKSDTNTKNEDIPVQEQPVTPIQKQTPVNITTPIPAVPQAESFTQEQLAVAMSNAVSAGKMNVVMGVLGQFNVQALTQVKPEDYNKLATMLREAGVTV